MAREARETREAKEALFCQIKFIFGSAPIIPAMPMFYFNCIWTLFKWI